MHSLLDSVNPSLAQLVIDVAGSYVPSDFSVSFAGTSFDSIMNSKTYDAIGTLIHFNGSTLSQFVRNFMKKAKEYAAEWDQADMLQSIPDTLYNGVILPELATIWSYIVPIFTELLKLNDSTASLDQIYCNITELKANYTGNLSNPLTTFKIMD